MSQIEAVIFDWAGTLVDFGSRAPMGAFVEAFAKFNVSISLAEARAPMGRAKRDHIAAIFANERVATAWVAAQKTPVDDAAIDAIYDVFLPLNIATAASHADAIKGAEKALSFLRTRKIKLGSTTGYTREIMNQVLPKAAEQGVETDVLFCSDELSAGRPSAQGVFSNFVALGVSSAHRCVKIDDTPVGIQEGVNAGTWTVGLTLSGNETGLSEAELEALSDDERTAARLAAEQKFRDVGAHFTIDSVEDLPALIEEIERRIASGERP